jgi:hypothetical protein
MELSWIQGCAEQMLVQQQSVITDQRICIPLLLYFLHTNFQDINSHYHVFNISRLYNHTELFKQPIIHDQKDIHYLSL